MPKQQSIAQQIDTTTPTTRAARRRFLGVIAGGGAALAGATLAAGPRSAPVAARQTGKGPVGSWLVTVPFTPQGRFITVQTFAADGTTVTQFESAGAERGATMGCGVWAQIGDRRFTSTFAAGIYDARTGATIGVTKVQANFELDEAGDTWRAEARFTIFDANGNQLEQIPLVTASATRIQLEPVP
jgi:hypothetical protein